MKKGKSFYLLLSTLLIFSMAIAACSSKTTDSSGEASGKTSSGDNSIEISMAQWGTAKEIKQTQDLLDVFSKKYPNIKVNLTYKSWDSYWTWLTAQASAKDLPDVYKIGSTYVNRYANLGAMQNLDSFIESSGFDMSNFSSNVLSYHKVDGHVVSMPRDANTVVMFYNKDMFDKAGLDYPKETMSWDQVLQLAQKLTIDKNGNNALSSSFDPKTVEQWGIVVDAAGTADSVLEPQLISNGARLVDESSHKLKLDTPEAMEVLKFLKSLTTKYHVNPPNGWLKNNGNDPFLVFGTGKVAMSFGGNWMVPQFTNAGIHFGVFLPPKFNEVKTVVQPAGYAMSPYANSDKQKAAWKLISWLTGPEGEKEMAKRGQGLPANQAAFEYYLKDYKDLNKQVFLDAQSKAVTTPVFEGKSKLWWTYIPQKLELPLDGKGSIEEAVQQIANLWNPTVK